MQTQAGHHYPSTAGWEIFQEPLIIDESDISLCTGVRHASVGRAEHGVIASFQTDAGLQTDHGRPSKCKSQAE